MAGMIHCGTSPSTDVVASNTTKEELQSLSVRSGFTQWSNLTTFDIEQQWLKVRNQGLKYQLFVALAKKIQHHA
jgi:hypothetical protein